MAYLVWSGPESDLKFKKSLKILSTNYALRLSTRGKTTFNSNKVLVLMGLDPRGGDRQSTSTPITKHNE